jgi:hypothetical protein
MMFLMIQYSRRNRSVQTKLDLTKKAVLILQSRVYRTYPYAKMASKLTALNKGIRAVREKRYMLENYLTTTKHAEIRVEF